jgi:hypothetical protein
MGQVIVLAIFVFTVMAITAGLGFAVIVNEIINYFQGK